VETYNYDSNGNLLSKLDRNGNTVSYTYDQLNRLTQKSYPDSTTVAYTYDLANHLTQVVDPTGTYGFTFDADGRLTQTSTQYSSMKNLHGRLWLRCRRQSHQYDRPAKRWNHLRL